MITPQEIDAGLRAYEQVQAFVAMSKKLRLIYTVLPLLLVITGIIARVEAVLWLDIVCWGTAAGIWVGGLFHWQQLREQDATNRSLLAQLEGKYGDDLPWLQVERQQAEIRRIQSEQN